ARQSILAGQGGNAAVLQPAEASVGADPERALRIEAKPVDPSLAQPVRRPVRCTDLILGEVHDAAVPEPHPYTTSRGVGGEGGDRVLATQPGRRKLLDLMARGHTKETGIVVCEPEAPA